MIDKPLVSVVIPTFNSECTLNLCLNSIYKQTYENFEIVIVDNYSSDKTKKIANSYPVKFIQTDASRSKARNIGINCTTGCYLLCIDSDMELTENVIKDGVEAFQTKKNVGGIIIPERSIGNNFWVKVRDFERSFYANSEIESARFFRKDIVDKVNGYEEDIEFFEESTLPQKIAALGLDVNIRIGSFILHHEYNFNLIIWLKKKYFYAKTLRLYSHKYKKYASKQASISYRYLLFLSNKRFYLRPLLASGVLLLKMLEFFSAGLGYLNTRK